MKIKNISLVFSAGCLGGLINSLTVWLLGSLGITAALGVTIAPKLTPLWLHPRIVWGGLWGFLFLLPYMQKSVFKRGFIYSLGPTLVQLFLIFPLKAKKGIMGFELGVLTPLFVIIFNWVWGIVAAFWVRSAEKNN